MTQWVIDLDGVMWRGRQPIEGSVEAVASLLQQGDRVVFCTNNSTESGESRAARLVEHGLAPGAEVVTSADAVGALVTAGERVLVVGGPGLRSAIEGQGAATVSAAEVDAGDVRVGSESFDAVVVGLTRDFDYRQLDAAAGAVRGGARLLASNGDTTFPGADGLHPGCGSLVAAVEAAAGRPALLAGKPAAPMVDLLRTRLGLGAGAGRGGASAGSGAPGSGSAHGAVVVVGDRPDTDGQLAAALGQPFGLVLSGVTRPEDLPVEVPTAWVADTLADLVALVRANGANREGR